MKLKKVIVPLVITILCCMYYACFAIVYAAGKVSHNGKILGIVIPGIIVVISIVLFLKNYAELRKEAAEFDAKLAREKENKIVREETGTEE